LAVYHGVSGRYPIVVAANRDEFFGRPAESPRLRTEPADTIWGKDLEAGGTWLGARSAQTDGRVLVAGLLNRRPEALAPGSPTGTRSRGLLTTMVLAVTSVDEARQQMSELDVGDFGPFNLFVADAQSATVFDNGDGLQETPLERGLTVLTNLDVRDPRCPRRAAAAERFGEVLSVVQREEDAAVIARSLGAALGDHEAGIEPSPEAPFSRICVHADGYGTRSSSIIACESGGTLHYFHAEGPPCVTPFERVL
jgi:uncharacterized protein with NRDE domain